VDREQEWKVSEGLDVQMFLQALTILGVMDKIWQSILEIY
jgi:hypothetical protein